MIERVIAMLQRAAIAPEVKQAVIAELQTLPDAGKSVQAQNGALMRACHVVRGYFTPAEAADDLIAVLQGRLTVAVPRKVVERAINRRLHMPLKITPESADWQELEVIQ